jgi:hypothetical protein
MSNRDFSLPRRFRSIFADRSGDRSFDRADGEGRVMPSHHLNLIRRSVRGQKGRCWSDVRYQRATQDWLTIDSQSAEGARLDRP